jgi:hypothetical protein
MGRKRTWTEDQFVDAVKGCGSIAGVLKRLNLNLTGANYKTVKMTVRRLSLDTSHWTGQGHLKGKTHNWTKKIPLSKILVVNSQYVSSSNLKRRLLREGVLEYLCSKCGITTWNEEPIILQLDHINGDNLDHRKENLRLLCPNCHSQTQTFAGRNIKKRDCHSTT